LNARGLQNIDRRGRCGSNLPRAILLALTFALAGSGLGPASALAANFPVTTTADSGAGSLRTAITNANGTTGVDTITFAIGSGPQTITPTSALPVITDSVVIDATGQPGFAGVPLVRLDGAAAGAGATGLTLATSSSTVRGLQITDWNGRGIEISGGASNVVAGNYIGTDGNSALPNGAASVIVDSGAVGNTIGGMTPADRNIISGGSSRGITVSGTGTSGNVIEGNFIGTNAAGTAGVPNQLDGVLVVNGATNNTTGGTTPGSGNLLSGNTLAGVDVTAASQNPIVGNLIGTDISGTKAVPNQKGVGLGGAAAFNPVGGTTPAARNVISGNGDRGVVIGAAGSNNNTVSGNYIGLDALANPLPNGFGGVLVFNSAKNNVIGGSVPGSGNVIAYNAAMSDPAATLKGGVGVIVDGSTSTGTSILGNSIFSNTSKIGIDIARGANGSQAPPVVSSIGTARKTTTIAGTAPSTGTRVEVFSNSDCGDPEGKTFLGSAHVSGSSWSLRVARISAGKGVTATDTKASSANTSAFSSCRTTPGRAKCKGKIATIVGSPGRDNLRGTRKRDVIAALGGNDVVHGKRGNDLICGGPGKDKLFGGPGNDKLFGGPGKDKLRGGPGRNKVHK
jgi:hypothetical protein